MIPFWIIATISLIGLGIATITDIKRREVPDYVNYSLLIAGIAIGAISSIFSWTIWPLVNAVAGFITGYVLAALLFYTGQWGGGDAKMLMGLGALHGIGFTTLYQVTHFSWPLFGTFFITIFFAGAVYSMIYFITLLLVKHKETKKVIAHERKKPVWKKLRIVVMLLLVTGVILALTTPYQGLRLSMYLLTLILVFGIYLFIFGRPLQQELMVKQISSDKLVPGDWLAQPLSKDGKIIITQKSTGLDEKQIAQIQQLGITHVTVKEGIPFIPAFLLAYIIILFLGNYLPVYYYYLAFIL